MCADPSTALGEGAIAGIVIGCLVGAGIASGATVAAFRYYRKRRVANFWKMNDDQARLRSSSVSA